MSGTDLPIWAVRLRDERTRRLWSQKTMAQRLRSAADLETRSYLPSVESIQRYVRSYEAGEHKPGDLYGQLYCRVFGLSSATLFGIASPSLTVPLPQKSPAIEDVRDLTAWISATNASEEAISHIDEATLFLAETHTRRPARQVLSEVIRLHQQTQTLLRSGKQRLRQTRELFRVDSDLLAHACLLLGDLNQDREAAAYGNAALMCAQEADANEAIAWDARAKTARWQERYAESADFARRGYDCSPSSPIRIQLAAREANAAGLLGDVTRAREALRRAERAAESMTTTDSGLSVWSFPVERQALFALSVATHTGDPDAALRAAAMADAGWAAGDPRVPANWAQIRLGAGIAHLMKGNLDATAAEVAPMLTLAPELRMSTVTRYLTDLDTRLKQRRFQHSPIATSLRQQISEFNSTALPADSSEENSEPAAGEN